MLTHIHTQQAQPWSHIHSCIHTYMQTARHKRDHKHVHAYIHTHMHTYIHTYIHTYTHTQASTAVIINITKGVHTFTPGTSNLSCRALAHEIKRQVYMYVCVCMYACVYVCLRSFFMYVCMYVILSQCMHVYAHTGTHTPIYIHTHKFTSTSNTQTYARMHSSSSLKHANTPLHKPNTHIYTHTLSYIYPKHMHTNPKTHLINPPNTL